MLNRDEAALVVIDVQGKLARLMDESADLLANLAKLIQGAKVLGLPVVVTEQNPEGLGPTVPEIAAHLPPERIAKRAFSCCGEPAFLAHLAALGRRQLVLAGIEAHVCVCQTALDLVGRGYRVEVVADAVSSRTARNRQIALDRMRAGGVGVTSVEMALFELLGAAEGDAFKAILKIVK